MRLVKSITPRFEGDISLKKGWTVLLSLMLIFILVMTACSSSSSKNEASSGSDNAGADKGGVINEWKSSFSGFSLSIVEGGECT
jgi:hypothetical protein